MKKILRQVNGNYVILNSPPPIPKFIICLLMKPMFSILTIAIKFDSLFLAIFRVLIDLWILFLTN